MLVMARRVYANSSTCEQLEEAINLLRGALDALVPR